MLAAGRDVSICLSNACKTATMQNGGRWKKRCSIKGHKDAIESSAVMYYRDTRQSRGRRMGGMGGARDREQRQSGGVLVNVHEATVGSSPSLLAAADAAGKTCDSVATATGHWGGGSASLPSNWADHAQSD